MFKTLLENVGLSTDESMSDLAMLIEEEMDELSNTFDELITPELDEPVVVSSPEEDIVEDDSIITAVTDEITSDAMDNIVNNIGSDDNDIPVDNSTDITIIDDDSDTKIDNHSIKDIVDEEDEEDDDDDEDDDDEDDDDEEDEEDDSILNGMMPDETEEISSDDFHDIDPDDIVGGAFEDDDTLIIDDHVTDFGDATDEIQEISDLVESIIDEL